MLEVVRTGKSSLIAEVSREALAAAATLVPEYKQLVGGEPPQSAMIVPLVARGRILGAMVLISVQPDDPYGERDLHLAEEVADRAALALDNARSYEETQARLRGEKALRDAIATLASSFTVDDIIHQIASSALIALDAEASFVERLDPKRGDVTVVAVAGERAPELGVCIPYEGSYAQKVIERGSAERIPDLGAPNGAIPKVLTERCAHCPAIAVPLLNSGEAIGALFLIRGPHAAQLSDDEMERASVFAELAALAFRKVHLLEMSEQTREELEAAIASRGRLMRGFTHDLRNPLGAANGFLQLLEQGMVGPLTPEQLDRVARARRAIDSAIQLLRDLQELTQIESRELEIEQQAVDVRDVARELAGEYQAQAEAKGLTLHAAIPDAFPVTRSDARRVAQILGNLLSNAVKYTERGSIDVSLRIVSAAERAPDSGEWIAVEVRDTGRGISAEELPLLFREFTRLAPDVAPGAGIGLAFSRRLAEALGGQITVTSEPGRGSAFTLWLPLVAQPAATNGKPS